MSLFEFIVAAVAGKLIGLDSHWRWNDFGLNIVVSDNTRNSETLRTRKAWDLLLVLFQIHIDIKQ